MNYDCLICNCQITAWLPADLCENIDYNLWQYNLKSEKSEKLRSSKRGNCSPWTVIKITTIHSTDCNQITMGIWTRWIIVIITTDIFAVWEIIFWISWCIKDLRSTKVMYCYVLKLLFLTPPVVHFWVKHQKLSKVEII